MSEKIIELMNTPLPEIEYQKKRLFMPTETQILDIHELLNAAVFNRELPVPPVRIRNTRHYGFCVGNREFKKIPHHAEITLHRKFHCIQWMIMILAHEMAHQYQWDVDGVNRLNDGKKPLLSHGPSFYKFRVPLMTLGIPLRKSYDSKLWINTQTSF